MNSSPDSFSSSVSYSTFNSVDTSTASTSGTLFWIVFIVAVAAVVTGLLFLWDHFQDQNDDNTNATDEPRVVGLQIHSGDTVRLVATNGQYMSMVADQNQGFVMTVSATPSEFVIDRIATEPVHHAVVFTLSFNGQTIYYDTEHRNYFTNEPSITTDGSGIVPNTNIATTIEVAQFAYHYFPEAGESNQLPTSPFQISLLHRGLQLNPLTQAWEQWEPTDASARIQAWTITVTSDVSVPTTSIPLNESVRLKYYRYPGALGEYVSVVGHTTTYYGAEPFQVARNDGFLGLRYNAKAATLYMDRLHHNVRWQLQDDHFQPGDASFYAASQNRGSVPLRYYEPFTWSGLRADNYMVMNMATEGDGYWEIEPSTTTTISSETQKGTPGLPGTLITNQTLLNGSIVRVAYNADDSSEFTVGDFQQRTYSYLQEKQDNTYTVTTDVNSATLFIMGHLTSTAAGLNGFMLYNRSSKRPLGRTSTGAYVRLQKGKNPSLLEAKGIQFTQHTQYTITNPLSDQVMGVSGGQVQDVPRTDGLPATNAGYWRFELATTTQEPIPPLLRVSDLGPGLTFRNGSRVVLMHSSNDTLTDSNKMPKSKFVTIDRQTGDLVASDYPGASFTLLYDKERDTNGNTIFALEFRLPQLVVEGSSIKAGLSRTDGTGRSMRYGDVFTMQSNTGLFLHWDEIRNVALLTAGEEGALQFTVSGGSSGTEVLFDNFQLTALTYKNTYVNVVEAQDGTHQVYLLSSFSPSFLPGSNLQVNVAGQVMQFSGGAWGDSGVKGSFDNTTVLKFGAGVIATTWTLKLQQKEGTRLNVFGLDLFPVPGQLMSLFTTTQRVTVANGKVVLSNALNATDYFWLQDPTHPLQWPGTHGRVTAPSSGVRRWSDASLWGGRVPGVGANVTLPENVHVVWDAQSVKRYDMIIVPSTSILQLEDAAMTLQATSIQVYGQLRAGSESSPVISGLTVEFLSSGAEKGIVGHHGSIVTLYGKPYQRTWSRLQRTALQGSLTLQLQHNVDWEPNQLVVITTTIFEDDLFPQNEVRRIASVSGKVVTLTEALSFRHYGGVEYQAEVGLLSRSLVVQGEESSQQAQFGGHISIGHIGRLSYVECHRMGQRNTLGHYPIHFHMVGKLGQQSLVQGCSVWESFFKGIVVHMTNELTISDNVLFDIDGHGIYFETGLEENNVVDNNLIAHIHPIGVPASDNPTFSQDGQTFVSSREAVDPSDHAASGIYITNPCNRFINNSTSGGSSGITMVRLVNPLIHRVHSLYYGIEPYKRPLLEFDNNTCHSAGYYWLRGASIYIGGLTKVDEASNLLSYNSGRTEMDTTLRDGKTPEFQRFTNTKIFLTNRTLNHWGLRAEVLGFEAYDLKRGLTVFGEAWINDAILQQRTSNGDVIQFPNGQGFQFYDTWTKTILTDVSFRNFKEDQTTLDPHMDNSVFIGLTISDRFKPMGISATRNITYSNVDREIIVGHKKEVPNLPNAVVTGSSAAFNIVDWDGTISGSGQKSIIGSHSTFWQTNDATFDTDWDVYIIPHNSEREVAHLIPTITGLTDNKFLDAPSIQQNIVGAMSQFGPTLRTVPMTRNPGITGLTGRTGWYMEITNPTGGHMSPQTWSLEVTQVPPGTYIPFAVRYPPGTTFVIRILSFGVVLSTLTSATSLSSLMKSDGKTQYFFTNGLLYLKVVGGPMDGQFVRDDVTIYGQSYSYFYSIQAFSNATTTTLNGTTYLPISGGRPLALTNAQLP